MFDFANELGLSLAVVYFFEVLKVMSELKKLIIITLRLRYLSVRACLKVVLCIIKSFLADPTKLPIFITNK